jgi:large subunit ribosomal protein L9
MQVILLEKVPNLGNLGEVVKVKDGFARNFLIPTRAARRATPAAIKEFEDKRAELEKAAADKLASAQALGEKMSGRTVHITQKAGVDGRLFGSVTNADVADALNRIDFKVQKSQVRMPNGPLKSVGEHTVTVAPHGDVVVEVKVVVLGETTWAEGSGRLACG